MATKSIKIREDVYNRLLEVKGESESFSDTINRLIERRSSVLAFSGTLKKTILISSLSKRKPRNFARAQSCVGCRYDCFGYFHGD